MQEEVENRSVNLAITTTKLTARAICSGIRKYVQHRGKVKSRKAADKAAKKSCADPREADSEAADRAESGSEQRGYRQIRDQRF